MKFINIIIIVLLLFSSVFAQTDTVRIIVHYKFSHIRDTTHPTEVSTENMLLFIGSNLSMYKSYDAIIQDSLNKKMIEQTIANKKTVGDVLNSGLLNINLGNSNSTNKVSYFIDKSLNQIISSEKILNKSYIIKDQLSVISWTITQETKKIADYNCQKATCYFRGRNYIAWFCTDLPFTNGPWKLGGLPGLLLEAYDEKKQVKFVFDGIEKTNASINIIQLPKNAITTTKKDLDNMKTAMRNDPSSFFGNSFGTSDNVIKVQMNPNYQKKVINNPIELTQD